jgi:RNA 3'-terminal phosphate cyclase (ATP)
VGTAFSEILNSHTPKQVIHVDGSQGEGGGQILRTSLALSAILGKPLKITAIRANRKPPGLKAQHLAGVKAVASITRAEVLGAELKSQTLQFIPKEIRGGSYQWDIAEETSSAGSVTLLLQAAYPPLLFSPTGTKLILKGGTHVAWSPTFNYFQEVFLPAQTKMGGEVVFHIAKWGWYPMGGGLVTGEIRPIKKLQGFQLISRGELKHLKGSLILSNLPSSIFEKQKKRFQEKFQTLGLKPEIETCEVPGLGKGCAVFLSAEFEGGRAGFSSLGARGKPAEQMVDEVYEAFRNYYKREGCIDEHLADQLLLFMALAEGVSSFTTSCLTQHSFTNMAVIQKFLPVQFEVQEEKEKYSKVTVKGIGFESSTS